jgi:hypothetical protein
MSKPVPFTKKSAGYKKMEELWEAGKIDKRTSPKDAYAMDPVFLQHKLDAFRAAFNKLKADNNAYLADPISRFKSHPMDLTDGSDSHSRK